MKASEKPAILPVVMLALAVAAAIKLADAGMNLSDHQPVGQLASVQPVTSPEDVTIDEADAPPPAPPAETDRRILEQLAARRADLDAREASLDAREGVIAAVQLRLRNTLEDVKAEQASLTALRDERQAASDEEIEGLIKAYERMKAKDAATIFNSLDESILVPVAAGMRTQALAGALAEMEPANARRLTILLADRSKTPGESAGPAE